MERQKMHDELEQEIFEQLTPLREVPARQPQAMKAGRERFLAQAAEIRASLPVSKPADMRLSKQKITFSTLFGLRKEPVPMIAQIGLAILLAVTVLAGGGATVYASQASQPDEFLYPVKIWSEDVRYDMAASEPQQLQLAVEFANRRLEELQAQQLDQLPVDEAVVQRLQLHVEESLQLMTRLNLSEEDQLQIQDQLRVQERLMQQLSLADGAPETALLLQVREMMSEQLRLAGVEAEQPVQTQQQNQQQQQSDQPETSPDAPQPGPGPQAEPLQEGSGPQNQNQSGEPAGVCPADQPDCDPEQQQTQQQDQSQQQNQDQQQEQPQQDQSQQQNQDNDSSSGSSDPGPKKGN
ncbi:MAG: hypothetical protein GYA48_18120 [Chloroflexi bacterium]|nr:hypothetical protein [Chloroflexota bacterium]